MAKDFNLREKVTSHIESQIQRGTLTSEDIINETTLCEQLSVSRTPVREALIYLVSIGVLVKVPNKGYKIVEFDYQRKMNTYSILAVLDALAASLAMDYMTETDILKMNEICDKIDIAIKYQNHYEYSLYQEQFHNVYISKCQNPTLIDMIHTLKSGPIKQTYYSPDFDKLFAVLKDVQEEHHEIIRLFREKNSTELEQFLRFKHCKGLFLCNRSQAQ